VHITKTVNVMGAYQHCYHGW